jgi:hypothetical protein
MPKLLVVLYRLLDSPLMIRSIEAIVNILETVDEADEETAKLTELLLRWMAAFKLDFVNREIRGEHLGPVCAPISHTIRFRKKTGPHPRSWVPSIHLCMRFWNTWRPGLWKIPIFVQEVLWRYSSACVDSRRCAMFTSAR